MVNYPTNLRECTISCKYFDDPVTDGLSIYVLSKGCPKLDTGVDTDSNPLKKRKH